MEETLQDKVMNIIGRDYHNTHYPQGGVDFDKVTEFINGMTNFELLAMISDALAERR